MRKPSAAMILSILLTLSWIGFFATSPRAAENTSAIVWQYSRVDGEKELAKRGREGWEAYAVDKPQSGIQPTSSKKPHRITVAGLSEAGLVRFQRGCRPQPLSKMFPMYLRNLRIAWSVAWGIAALLLIVLWVRSYWGRSSSEILVTPSHRYYVHSIRGTVAFEREMRVFITVEIHRVYAESDFLRLTTNAGLRIVRNEFDGSLAEVSISYWLLTAATVFVGAVPWLRWRFSLRTMLVVTTLVAIVLGWIVWQA